LSKKNTSVRLDCYQFKADRAWYHFCIGIWMVGLHQRWRNFRNCNC